MLETWTLLINRSQGMHSALCLLQQHQYQGDRDGKGCLYLFSACSPNGSSQVSKSVIQVLFCTAVLQELSLFVLCLLPDGITLKVNK